MKARNRVPRGSPGVPQHWCTQCLCSAGLRALNNGQGPKAVVSLDRKNSTSTISAAESFGWLQKDAENAALKLHSRTCRFQKPIPLSQSLLLTSKYENSQFNIHFS